MNLIKYHNLAEAVLDMQKRRYVSTFTLRGNRVYCLQTQKSYQNNEIKIIEYHRFNTDIHSLNRVIIFGIICNDGEKGYVISSRKANEIMNLLTFMNKVKIAERDIMENNMLVTK